MRNKILIALAVLSLGFANCASGQTPTRSLGRLIQIVDKATFNPVDSAQLVDPVDDSYLMTNAQGAANLEFTGRLGLNRFYVRKIGYIQAEVWYTGVGLNSPDTVVTIYLERVATMLPTAITMAESPTASFDLRVRAGFGRFLTPEELKKPKYESLSVAQAIRTLGQGAAHRGQACYNRILLDGREMKGPFLQGMMDDPIRHFEAVEFYPSALRAPVEYRTSGSCGVMIFWTKIPKG